MNAPWELPIESQRLGFPGIHSPVILGSPNITGSHNTSRYFYWENSIDGQGAFAKSNDSHKQNMIDNGSNENHDTNIAIFDASDSNSIYSKSTTIQPSSCYALMIIKE